MFRMASYYNAKSHLEKRYFKEDLECLSKRLNQIKNRKNPFYKCLLNKTELHKVIELREGKYLLGCEDTYEIFDSKVRKIVKLKKDKHWKSNCRAFYKINDKLILIIFNDYTFGGKSISLWKYTV